MNEYLGLNISKLEDIFQFFEAVYARTLSENPSFSLRAWAKHLKLSNSMSLSRILRKKILPSPKLLEAVMNQARLGKKEKQFVRLLLVLESSTSEEQRLVIKSVIQEFKVSEFLEEGKITGFEQVSDWYCLVILEMTFLKDFSFDPIKLSAMLGGKVSPEQIKYGIEKLLRFGLLEKDIEGRLVKSHKGHLWIQGPNAASAIRNYHEQVLEVAKAAVREKSIDERYLSSINLTIRLEDRATLIKWIDQLRKKAAHLSINTVGKGEETVQLNCQLLKFGTGT